MIDYDTFAGLRLSQFANPEEIRELSYWEFMEELWIGEAVGFTEWLRRKTAPDRLGALSLDLRDFPRSSEVLELLELPLSRGMELDAAIRVLGKPIRSIEWSSDRRSYEFLYPRDRPYFLDCTFTDGEGLHHVVVMTRA